MTKKVSRRHVISTAAGATAAALLAQPSPAQQSSARQGNRRPNIVFILADDLGYGDLSCYGRPEYKTPVLDKFATEGMKFMSAYAAAPVCTPTRVAFHTGRYPQRLPVGLYEPLQYPQKVAKIGLAPDHPTVASLLKKNGYATSLIGKWHMGWEPEFGPNRHGFDEFFGILSGAADYFTHKAADGGGGVDLWENLTPVDRLGYLTDLFTDKAIEFIQRKRSNPFFLCLCYTAPHSPWEGPEDAAIGHEDHGPGAMAAGGSMQVYASMMKNMDTGIGKILAALKKSGLERDTLVIFTSDNGGERYSFNWPFQFKKMFLWEGGLRVPAMVRWPDVIPAGKVTEQATVTMDWSATMLAVAGASPDPSYPFDGENLMPVLTGAKSEYDRTIFFRIKIHDAVRSGRWKYLKEGGNEHLFDVVADPGEHAELKTKHPEVFEKLRNEFAAWNAKMLPKLT
jgi:arylsulfatase A-like enzyme